MQKPNYSQIISKALNITELQVKNTISLLDDGNTVHFISRYRKEITGNLDENYIRDIITLKAKEENLFSLKQTALTSIQEQDKLTDELKKSIVTASTLKAVEDLYTPYKRKKETKADIAIKKGFKIIANQIINQHPIKIPSDLLNKYTKDEILSGAKDIISQEIADNAQLKDIVRKFYIKQGRISSKFKNIDKFNTKQIQDMHKFKIYDSFFISISKIKSHQILAINRGESLNILTISIEKNDNIYEIFTERIARKNENREHLLPAIKEGYKKIFSSIENEIRKTLTERANIDGISVFQKNLKELLMLKPHYGEKILAIDPGFRTGCKIAILESNGKPIHYDKIFLNKQDQAIQTLKTLHNNFNIDMVVIGNGTASKETTKLVSNHITKNITIVNESGASVYSTSKVSQEEFPNLDATDRGTISIGRRYIDSLSELVKVPVISIGVGMYQHDMNQKELKIKLKEVVEDVVNLVGININTASPYLLNHVSGLTKKSAQKIHNNAPYKSRNDLKKIITPKAFQQSVGFLRLKGSSNSFDETAIHPEQYDIAKFLINHIGETSIFTKYNEELKTIMPEITEDIVDDILENYNNRGKELREFEGNLKIQKEITIETLTLDEKITGIVRNVTSFGAFVDIGLKNNALVHISQMADKFIKNPNEIVTIGQEITAKVIEIDTETGKVKLSMKQL